MVERKKTEQSADVVRPNFGQHTPAIEELLKQLAQVTKYRTTTQESVDNGRQRLQDDEQRLANFDRQLESFRSAILALGGRLPD
jgi:hypothetical protein